MVDYGKFISEKRKAVQTPEDIISNGKAVFGTFDKEFEKISLLDAEKPAGKLLPKCMNKLKLTLWEATEVNLKDGILLVALCDMGLFGMNLNVFYDKTTKKQVSWSYTLPKKKTEIAPNLVHGSVTEGSTKGCSMKYVNNFEKGESAVEGKFNSKKSGDLEYHFDLSRISLPSIVSIPFGENRPLYSQKDLFKAQGYLVVNGKRYDCDDETTAIIDDHKGYYPRKMHYDWVTTLGKNEIDGEQKFFGFNLTRNQSVNQDDYNENLIWLEGASSALPPVKFAHNEDDTVWTVTDEHDMVNVTFDIGDMLKIEVHAGIIDINYHITFGTVKGFVRGTDGKKYTFDGLAGIGEDKSMKF